MKYLLFILIHIPDIIISIYLNFKLLPLHQAIHLPILFSHDINCNNLKRGTIILGEHENTFSVKIGIEGVDGISPYRRSFLCLSSSSKVYFRGKASISKGFSIRNSGFIEFGEDFYSNCNLSIICNKKIVIGRDCIFGWNVHLRDCDGHSILSNNSRHNFDKEVIIGNHVWIGQDVKILKGSSVPNNSVVAINSCVLSMFEDENVIIGGYPARIVKTNIHWMV